MVSSIEHSKASDAASMTWNAGPEFGDKLVQSIFFVSADAFQLASDAPVTPSRYHRRSRIVVGQQNDRLEITNFLYNPLDSL